LLALGVDDLDTMRGVEMTMRHRLGGQIRAA
jgi:hypothetical protein